MWRTQFSCILIVIWLGLRCIKPHMQIGAIFSVKEADRETLAVAASAIGSEDELLPQYDWS